MYRAGYDPQAFITFFEKVQALEKRKPGLVAKAFSDHPQTPDRILHSQEEIARILPAKHGLPGDHVGVRRREGAAGAHREQAPADRHQGRDAGRRCAGRARGMAAAIGRFGQFDHPDQRQFSGFERRTANAAPPRRPELKSREQGSGDRKRQSWIAKLSRDLARVTCRAANRDAWERLPNKGSRFRVCAPMRQEQAPDWAELGYTRACPVWRHRAVMRDRRF